MTENNASNYIMKLPKKKFGDSDQLATPKNFAKTIMRLRNQNEQSNTRKQDVRWYKKLIYAQFSPR